MVGAPPMVVLPRFLEPALETGHPWVYRDHVPPQFTADSGTWVQVRAGKRSGFGLWDAKSPIAIRLFATGVVPDQAWVHARVRAAWELRAPLRDAGVTAYRWLYGEGDLLPALVVDLYGSHAVLVTYADAVEPLVPWVVEALATTTPLSSVVRRRRALDDRSEGLQLLRGQPPPKQLVVVEHGARFQVELERGQKTGLFLDHRENRRFAASLARGRRVLNLFAYTGGFSVHAARAGATEVVSVDSAAPAIQAAAENLALNGLDPARHPTVVADAFAYLERARAEAQRFDLVISDPPSFARSRAQRHGALRSYVRLHAASLQLVAPEGYYAAASCTAQVSPTDFLATLAEGAARAQRRLQIVHEAGHPLDHPVAAHHPEGRYLKFVAARVSSIP